MGVQRTEAAPKPVQTVDERIAAALNDVVTPQYIDDGEYQFLFGAGKDPATASKAAPLLKDPPIVRRIFDSAEKARDWCRRDICETRRRKSAEDFYNAVALTATRSGLAAYIPEETFKEWGSIAQKMAAESPDPIIRSLGAYSQEHIKQSILRKRSGLYEAFNTQFHGDASYLTSEMKFKVIPGMEGPVNFWRKVFAEDANHMFLTPRHSNSRVIEIDLKDKVMITEGKNGEIKEEDISWAFKGLPKKYTIKAGKDKGVHEYTLEQLQTLVTERILEKLNSKMGCKAIRNERGFISNWVMGGKKGLDLYTYKRGQGKDIEGAVEMFREYQPYLESIFISAGLPPYLACIVIFESKMIAGRDSPEDARGTFQIIDRNMNDPKLDLYWDEDLDIDERRNIFLSARTATRILNQGRSRILEKAGARPQIKEDFVPGMTFDLPFATMMATSAYNAGAENLRAALTKAKETLDKMSKAELKKEGIGKIDGEALFSYVLTHELTARDYKNQSKDYPPKLYPVIEQVYSRVGEPAKNIPDVVLVEIPKLGTQLISIADILSSTNADADEFFRLNPQFKKGRANVKLNLSKSTLKALRFVMPRTEALRLKLNLEKQGLVQKDAISVQALLNSEILPGDIQTAIESINHYATVTSPARFDIRSWLNFEDQ